VPYGELSQGKRRQLRMKFRAHDTFYIRKGWLYKGISNVTKDGTVFLSKDINPTDIFGMGTNMVKALRYWLQATGLTMEKRRGSLTIQELTEIGKLIQQYDPYMEEPGTITLLHYHLAKSEELATSWYYFFNVFAMSEFGKEDFVEDVANYIKMKTDSTVALESINEDFICILNTYIPRTRVGTETIDPEDNRECPLSELGLIDIVDKKKKIYKKTTPKRDYLPLRIMLGMIVNENPGQAEIRIQDLMSEKNSIGKLFNLDIISLTSYLDKMQNAGLIRVIRTAGLDIIKILEDMTFEEHIAAYYTEVQ
jgi:hypothetical protein